MYLDGIRLTEGSTVTNISVETGANFPNTASTGELFLKTGESSGLYIYHNAAWTLVQTSVDAPPTHTHDYAATNHLHTGTYAPVEAAYNLGSLSSSATLNATNGVVQYGAVTGSVSWTFSGAAAAPAVTCITLELTNGGLFAQTWPTSVDWDSGTAPTLTASGTDILVFYTYDGGVTWRGFLAAKDIK